MENNDVICISSDGGDSDDAVSWKYNNKDIGVSRIKLEKIDLTLINDDSDFEEPNKEKDLTWIQTKKIQSSDSNSKPEPTWIRTTNKSDSSGSRIRFSNGSHVKCNNLNQPLNVKEVESICNKEKSINNISDIRNGHTPEEVTNGFNNKVESTIKAINQSPIFNTGEVSILKRKAVPDNEISNDKIDTTPVKRIKLTKVSRIVPTSNCPSSPKPSTSKISAPLISNDNSSHSTNDRNSPTPGCSWHFEVEKPKLIIKERKVLYDDEFDLFSTFIETCMKRDFSEDMKEIIKRLKKKHEKLHPTFLNSDRFKQLLIDKQQMISENEGKLFIHIQEVKNEMKHGEKRSRSLEKNARKAIDGCEETLQNVDKGKKQKKEDDLEKNEDRRKRKKLEMIQNSIEICKKRIKQLEEEEVDLDDDHESSYLIVDKYKRKLVQLWNAYCKYSGEKVDAGRAFLRPKHISATLIAQVDQAIMSFINSKISKRNELIEKGRSIADTVIFPDYADILKCISKCNSKYNLELSKLTMEIKAKEAFLKIGEHLQRVRQTDYWDTFSLYLEEEDDDPALKDPLLAEKLGKNYLEGKKKMSDILEVYTQKQENRAEQLNQSEDQDEDAEAEADEDDDDDEEEKEDDDDDSEAEVDVEDIDEKRDNETDDDDSEKFPLIGTKAPHISNPPANNPSKENEFRDSPKTSAKDSSNELHDNPSKNGSFEAKDSSGDVDLIEVEDEEASKSNKQPLLRLRSFAKPPTSWDDSLQAEASPIIRSSKFITLTPSPKIITSTPKPSDAKVAKVPPGSTFVDLTSEKGETQPKPGIRRVIDPSYVSTLKSKYKTVLVPSNFKGKQIISVKNITNNYNVVNAPGKSGLTSASQTRIRIPGQSTSTISPRKPVQVWGNKIPEEAQRVVVDKNYVKTSQLLTKPSVRPVFYPSAANSKILTKPEGQMVRLKSFVPNPEAKVMKVLKLNEARKVSITPLQKHSVVNKVLMSPKGQSNNQLSPRKIQANSRIDHQYSKRIFNNVIRILKPGEQNCQNIHSDRPIKK